METKEIEEKLINNLKRERTLLKNVEWNDDEHKRKSGENALNIGAVSRSKRIHSILLFCSKFGSLYLLLADVSMTNTLNF